MKYSKAEVHCKTHGLPALRFEDSQLTSRQPRRRGGGVYGERPLRALR